MHIPLAMLSLLLALGSFAQGVQIPMPQPNDKNWKYLATSDDGNDILYMPKISYGNDREIWWFVRDRDPSKEININLERYNCEIGASRLLRVDSYLRNEFVTSSSFDKDDWGYAETKTIGQLLLKAACGQ